MASFRAQHNQLLSSLETEFVLRPKRHFYGDRIFVSIETGHAEEQQEAM
uniref:Transcriptional regulator n=1 Tax=Heterorhabditis bacteriophora TaxID=37862 RepID=A0A1I7X1C6_HETBA